MPSRELITVACLDTVERGVIRRIPRHVTIMPWFRLEAEEVSPLRSELASVLRHVAPIEIIGGEEAQFGPESDILARRVGERAVLLGVHMGIKNVVGRFGGAVRSPQYTGEDGYQPHVSKQEDGYFDIDERQVINSLQLIEVVDSAHGRRNIIAQLPLEG